VWNCDIGIELACETYGKNTSNVTVRNNLVYGCQGFCGLSIGGADSSNGGADNIKIYNNTLYNNATNMNIQLNCQVASNVIKNNIFYIGTEFEGTRTGITISNNLNTNPDFVNASANDFRLQSNSGAIDKGANDSLAGTLDLNGNNRIMGGIVDIGCFEFVK
jgi:hypothetical protein